MKKYLALLLILGNVYLLKAQENNTTNINNNASYSRYYDTPPRFTGNSTGNVFQYITEHVQCPKNITQDISGQINIHAIIDSVGFITDMKVIRSISPEVDQAILYTLANTPRSQPAIYKGRNVPVFFAVVMDVTVDARRHKIKATRNVQAQIKEMQTGKRIFDVAPTFPNEGNNFFKYVTDNINYPEGAPANIRDVIDIHFDIDTTGGIKNISMLKNVSKEVDQAFLDVLASAPKFTPGMLNGRKVLVQFALIMDVELNTDRKTLVIKHHYTPPKPLVRMNSTNVLATGKVNANNLHIGNTTLVVNNIQIDQKNNSNAKTTTKDKVTATEHPISKLKKDSVYAKVDVAPSYPDGTDALAKFIKDNINYPEYAKKNHVQGQVLLSFVVEKNGALTDFKVVKSPSEDLGDEAIRVVKSSANWVPGIRQGKPVRASYSLPVDFSL